MKKYKSAVQHYTCIFYQAGKLHCRSLNLTMMFDWCTTQTQECYKLPPSPVPITTPIQPPSQRLKWLQLPPIIIKHKLVINTLDTLTPANLHLPLTPHLQLLQQLLLLTTPALPSIKFNPATLHNKQIILLLLLFPLLSTQLLPDLTLLFLPLWLLRSHCGRLSRGGLGLLLAPHFFRHELGNSEEAVWVC